MGRTKIKVENARVARAGRCRLAVHRFEGLTPKVLDDLRKPCDRLLYK
jgi:hypothetical protein